MQNYEGIKKLALGLIICAVVGAIIGISVALVAPVFNLSPPAKGVAIGVIAGVLTSLLLISKTRKKE